MRYCDLHSDALTTSCAKQTTKENLLCGECLLQCFAAFLSSREHALSKTLALADAFYKLCEREGYHVVSDTEVLSPGVNAMLTVEGGEAIEGRLENIKILHAKGVRMMTLTWNNPNEIGYPAFPDYGALTAGKMPLTVREETRGLTPFGFACVEEMNALSMIVDVSHGSDRLVSDVASCSKKPFVASHSNSDAVYRCARNLKDDEIRLIADSGGVVGLNFCADFLSADKSEDGQRLALLAHARAIVNAGGENCLAFGSDFDGIPENAYMKNPSCMPRLLDCFVKEFGYDRTEKFACFNVLRVLKEV